MSVVGFVLAVVLLALAGWGWWVIPRLMARDPETDGVAREQRANEYRRGVVAFFAAAMLVLWVSLDSCGGPQ
jgi:hypothetical protein